VPDGHLLTGTENRETAYAAEDAPRPCRVVVGCDPAGMASKKSVAAGSLGGGSQSRGISASRPGGSPRTARETFPIARAGCARSSAAMARTFVDCRPPQSIYPAAGAAGAPDRGGRWRLATRRSTRLLPYRLTIVATRSMIGRQHRNVPYPKVDRDFGYLGNPRNCWGLVGRGGASVPR
jgi:hypothetical protein